MENNKVKFACREALSILANALADDTLELEGPHISHHALHIKKQPKPKKIQNGQKTITKVNNS